MRGGSGVFPRKALFGVIALATVAVLFTASTLVLYSNLRFDGQTSYSAVFTDVSGLRVGDDVRIAGATVGQIDDVEVQRDSHARVTFTAASDNPLMVGSRAIVRYKNLVGQRYLELTEGTGPNQTLPPGGVIPVTQTAPALDLDELYNGFAPLFAGLQPDQVNQLSGSLIQVFQGQGGSVSQLLGSIGTFTSALANKDAVIGQLVSNLNGVLDTANRRGPQLSNLVVQLQQLVSGLAAQRQEVGDSLAGVDTLTGSVAGLLQEARPSVAGDINETNRLAGLLNTDKPALNTLLQRLPGYYQILGRLGIYQSAFQFFLCGAQIRLETAPGAPPIMSGQVSSQEPRCRY